MTTKYKEGGILCRGNETVILIQTIILIIRIDHQQEIMKGEVLTRVLNQ